VSIQRVHVREIWSSPTKIFFITEDKKVFVTAVVSVAMSVAVSVDGGGVLSAVPDVTAANAGTPQVLPATATLPTIPSIWD